MASQQSLERKLQEALNPAVLKVFDNSGGCGANFDVIVVSSAFEGKRLLERQRLVNEVIREDMKAIHALTMKCHTPAEWEKKKTAE